MHDTLGQWAEVQATDVVVFMQRCDTAQLAHINRLAALTHEPASTAGVWHAAGVLLDGRTHLRSSDFYAESRRTR